MHVIGKWFSFLIILALVCAKIKKGEEILFDYEKTRGEGYGSEWIYFPDEDGNLHFVNLSDTSDESLSIRMDLEIDFKLYSKRLQKVINFDDSAALLETSSDLAQSGIFSNPIKIITHGWMSSAEKSAVMNIADSYLSAKNEVTVITVDWSSYSMNLLYPQVASQTRDVGLKVARFINALQKRYNIMGDQIHLIGHSLGAHVMGVAGFESLVSVGRITGLDPALPAFSGAQSVKTRLDFMDATYVDVIHTSGGLLGFFDAIGTADFYPNNGTPPQPGCNIFTNLFYMDACSHGRSHKYFAESILRPESFPAYSCNNNWTNDLKNVCQQTGYMGEGANLKSRGIFFSITNSQEPFGRG